MKYLRNLLNSYLLRIILPAIFICFAFSLSYAQSTNQGTPTFVTTNEISGTIRARDIGDSRLTNYFYTFNGNQGDVFINVVTKNLDGDIDIFTLDGLKPLTKITLFSDNSDNETGRIVYLRKFEKLLLRVQGRSPNDDPATFRIKFAGSFQPLENIAGSEEPNLPEINTQKQGEVRVNSVGTIIEVKPKLIPKPKEVAEIVKTEDSVSENKEITVKSVENPKIGETSAKIEIRKGTQTENVAKSTEIEKITTEEGKTVNAKPLVIITDSKIEETVEKEEPKIEVEETEKIVAEPEKVIENKEQEITEKVETEETSTNTLEPLKTEQLAKIELVVKFKDGKTLKRPLSKVFSFNVNQGILTIILYDGSVSRYSFLDIEKISIEDN